MKQIRVHKLHPYGYQIERDEDGMVIGDNEIYINIDHIVSVEHGPKYFIEDSDGKKHPHWHCLIRVVNSPEPIGISESVNLVNGLIRNAEEGGDP